MHFFPQGCSFYTNLITWFSGFITVMILLQSISSLFSCLHLPLYLFLWTRLPSSLSHYTSSLCFCVCVCVCVGRVAEEANQWFCHLHVNHVLCGSGYVDGVRHTQTNRSNRVKGIWFLTEICVSMYWYCMAFVYNIWLRICMYLFLSLCMLAVVESKFTQVLYLSKTLSTCVLVEYFHSSGLN